MVKRTILQMITLMLIALFCIYVFGFNAYADDNLGPETTDVTEFTDVVPVGMDSGSVYSNHSGDIPVESWNIGSPNAVDVVASIYNAEEEGEYELFISGTGQMIEYYAGFSIPWHDYFSDIVSIVIDEGITSISGYSFLNCAISTITIPSSIEAIGQLAFSDCTIESITIPENVKSIGRYCFQSCNALTTVVIENGIDCIPEGCFLAASALKRVNIPDSVTSIERNAFNNCHSLERIVLPDNLERIVAYAFYNCEALKYVEIPSGVIENEAFKFCLDITTIVIGNNVSDIETGAFTAFTNPDTVVISTNPVALNHNWQHECRKVRFGTAKYECGKSDDSDLMLIVLSDKSNYKFVLSGNDEMLDYDSSDDVPWKTYIDNVDGLIMCEGIKSIGKNAFNGCDKIPCICIPDGVETIGDMAFYNCLSAANIEISDSVTSIGAGAFHTDERTDTNIFTYNDAYLQYDWDSGKRDTTVLAVADSYKCGNPYEEGVKLFVVCDDEDNTKYHIFVTGCGEMKDSEFSARDWDGYKASAISVDVENGITRIGGNSFNGFSSIKNINFGDNISFIGWNAFRNSCIESVTIPDSVLLISTGAFMNCSCLTKINFGSGINSIFDDAFKVSAIDYSDGTTGALPTVISAKNLVPNEYDWECDNRTLFREFSYTLKFPAIIEAGIVDDDINAVFNVAAKGLFPIDKKISLSCNEDMTCITGEKYGEDICFTVEPVEETGWDWYSYFRSQYDSVSGEVVRIPEIGIKEDEYTAHKFSLHMEKDYVKNHTPDVYNGNITMIFKLKDI